MSKQLYSNNGESTLAADILIGAGPTGVPIVLQTGDGAKFKAPTAPEFQKVTLTDGPNETRFEIFHVTSRTGDTLTADRAQEGTVAQDWLSACKIVVSARVTDGTLSPMHRDDESFVEALSTPASVAGVLDLDFNESNNFAVLLFEDVTTLNFNNLPASGPVVPITIEFTQDGTGGWTVAFPAAVKTPGGVAIVVTAAPGAVDVIAGFTRDAGTNIRLARAMEDSS